MGTFEIYLIAINIIGALATGVNYYLYSHTPDKSIDPVITVLLFLGGSLGIFIVTVINDIKIKYTSKENKQLLMSRIALVCFLVIQVIIVLIVEGVISEDISVSFWRFIRSHKVFMIYLIAINIITAIVYGVDKANACKGRWRVPNNVLIALAFIGGSIGALIAMYLFRHKTKKIYFKIGIPLIIITQIVVLFFVMNAPR